MSTVETSRMTPGKTTLWYLMLIPLFAEMPEPEMEALAKITRMETFTKRQPIYLPGDPGRQVYLLKNGRVRISQVSPDGKEVTLALLEPGEVFGVLEALGDQHHDTVAEALDDHVDLCVIQRKDFEAIVMRRPDLAFKLTKQIGRQLKQVENRLADLVFKDVPARLADLLVRLADEFGEPAGQAIRIAVRLTHQELAGLIGSTRETVTLTLGEFRRKDLMAFEGRQILVRDKAALARLAQARS